MQFFFTLERFFSKNRKSPGVHCNAVIISLTDAIFARYAALNFFLREAVLLPCQIVRDGRKIGYMTDNQMYNIYFKLLLRNKQVMCF